MIVVIMRVNRELKINPSNIELPWISHLVLIYLLTLHTFSHKSSLLYFSLCFHNSSKKKKKKEVAPTLTAGAGAPSAVVAAVFRGAQQGPAPRPALTARSASMWACRSCWAVLMRWRSSVTWARQTLPRAFGWVWSSEALRARMTALLAAAATSPAGQDTACWSVPAASPTAASTVHAWWTKTVENGGKQGGVCREASTTDPSDVLTFSLWAKVLSFEVSFFSFSCT